MDKPNSSNASLFGQFLFLFRFFCTFHFVFLSHQFSSPCLLKSHCFVLSIINLIESLCYRQWPNYKQTVFQNFASASIFLESKWSFSGTRLQMMDTFPEQTVDKVLSVMWSKKLILTFTKMAYMYIQFLHRLYKRRSDSWTVKQLIFKTDYRYFICV